MSQSTLPDALRVKLARSVRFDSDADQAAFLADAINTYIALGQQVRAGVEIYLRPAPDAPLRRVRLPFETIVEGDTE